MKKPLIMIMGVLMLSTAACERSKIDENVTKVVEFSKQICSFVPTDATVVALINAMGGAGPQAIATAICNAVTAPSAATRSMNEECPKVKDICIEGEFMPKDEGEPK